MGLRAGGRSGCGVQSGGPVGQLTVRLLLESALALDGEFGSHLVGLVSPKMSFGAEVVVVDSKRHGIMLLAECFFGGPRSGLWNGARATPAFRSPATPRPGGAGGWCRPQLAWQLAAHLQASPASLQGPGQAVHASATPAVARVAESQRQAPASNQSINQSTAGPLVLGELQIKWDPEG